MVVKIGLLLYVSGAMALAEPPMPVTVGGSVAFPSGAAELKTAAWRVYAVTNSAVPATGTVALAPGQQQAEWYGEMVSAAAVGKEQMFVISAESASGTTSNKGYYAVMNMRLSGDDPAVFSPVTLRPIPVPDVAADAYTYLVWEAAAQDAGENGMTNIVGYNVFRSADGTNFARITSQKVTRLYFTDPIPDDAEYRYALGLVFRGAPAVMSSAVSAASTNVFKDSNIDGLPDYFAIAAGLDPGASDWDNGPWGDPYNVGMINYDAWISGALPQDSTTWLRAGIVGVGDGLQTLRWNGVHGRKYWVAATDNIMSGNWDVVYGPAICTADQVMEYTDWQSAYYSQRFYRILVEKD